MQSNSQQNKMIGSLGDFIGLANDQIFEKQSLSSDRQPLISKRSIHTRGKSTYVAPYVPQDKTKLLALYQKNNIYKINQQKYDVISKEARSIDRVKKPLYEHRSFFVKPEVNKDYIAKEELKRKHNLLRAILRMKQSEEQPRGDSDYEQSFQRLYSGFKAIHPEPIIQHKEENILEQEELPTQKAATAIRPKAKSHLTNYRRLEFQHCLSWAKKHNKNGEFFEQQLGKGQSREKVKTPLINRSLIDDIEKKIDQRSWNGK